MRTIIVGCGLLVCLSGCLPMPTQPPTGIDKTVQDLVNDLFFSWGGGPIVIPAAEPAPSVTCLTTVLADGTAVTNCQ